MASSTTIHTALTNLAVQLAARSYVTTNNVAVCSGPHPLGYHGAQTCCELWATEADEDWAMLGARSTEEVYTIHGGILAWSAGSSEAAIVDARDKAMDVYQEVQAQLRESPSINSAVRVARMQRATVDQWFDDTGRLCQVEFWIRCEARLSGS